MNPSRIPAACWLLIVPVAILFAFGLVRLHYNLDVFRSWIREDSLLEWLTWAGLIGMAALAAARARALSGSARTAWIVLALVLFFGGMEEISWAQRVVGWHSPEWFLQYNDQDETTIHNLEFGRLNVNKVVFGKLLGALMAFYALAVPLLYRRRPRVRDWFDARALPVPRAYQTVLMLAAWGIAELGRAKIGKAGEVQELGIVFALATVLLHPLNAPAHPPLTSWLDAALEALRRRAGPALQDWLSPRLRFLLLATVLLVAGFGLFRLTFAAAFEPPGLVGPVGKVVWDRGVSHFEATGPGLVPAADLAYAWFLGSRFDLRIALLILLPFALLGAWRVLDPARTPAARRLWLGYFAVALGGAFLLHIVDLGHYAYEAERLNVGLLDHMREASIAAGMVWETYPVARIALALAALTAGAVWLLARWLPAPGDAPAPRRRAVTAAAVALYVFGLHGQWSQYPLRWSNAYFTTNGYLTALASNPVQTLFDSWRTPLPSVDAAAACEAQAVLAPFYGLQPCAAPPPSFARRVEPPARSVPPNVVVVFLESFSAFKTGIMGNALDPTPNFDALARSSVLFTHFYSAARPTARSIFSSLFGIADVSTDQSASRNPRAVGQHTLVNAFAGYRKHYFIGGSASWGNIRGMLAHNIPDLQLHEGEDSDLPGNDVWGASDLALLEDAHRVLAAESSPFIAFIQTAGNHRPYTIPDDARGFVRSNLPEEKLLAAGFEEPDAYDGMRFMDHALGHFMALAAAAPYYDNTVFAFYGDHGSPARRFPPHEQDLRRMHVPLVLHAPRLLGAARRIDAPASSLDVLPTLTALAGLPHRNTTLGRDLFAARPDEARFAFVAYESFRGLVDAEAYYARDASGRETLRRMRADGAPEADELAGREPERLARMRRLAGAVHASSAWLLLNNAPGAEAVPDAAAAAR